LAAGLTDDEDPPDRYQSDPLTGERDGPALTYAERYVGVAREVERIGSLGAFAVRFPEINEALPFLGGTPAASAERMYDLYRRHAAGVGRAIKQAFGRHLDELYWQTIPARSLLGLAMGRRASPPPLATPPGEHGLVVDNDKFEILYHGRPCITRNTLEYRVTVRLARCVGVFVPLVTLGEDVWEDGGVPKYCVQRVASTIRKCFRNAGFEEVQIDHAREAYRLLLPPGTPVAM